MSGKARRAAVIVAVLAVLAGAGTYAFFAVRDKIATATGCTFTDASGKTELDTDKAAIASTLAGVVTTKNLPDRAAFLLIMAAWQESGLRNLPYGDRDSVGVLQQRPSQGWGTPEQISDVHYASTRFLDELVKQDDWKTADPAHVIDTVQRSADESAYNQHKDEAQALAQVLLGNVPAGLSCEFDKPTVVATPAKVAEQLQADLPVNKPAVSGRTVSVPGAGWQTAIWFVANADRLGIDSVGYAGKRWTRADQWNDDGTAKGTAVVATLAELKK